MDKCILSVDAGGTYLKAALVTPEGEIIPDTFMKVPVNSDGELDKIIESYTLLAKSAKDKAQGAGREITAVGVCIPGPFDYENGICRMTHKYVSIFGIPMRPWFEAVLGNVPITFVHDSAGFILGATRNPKYAQYKKIGGVMLGTGLGFATMENGVVMKNESGGPAVSIYNVPYKGKTAEEYCSRRAVIRTYYELVPDAPEGLDAYEICCLATKGDKNAFRTYEMLGENLAAILHDVLRDGGYECLLLGGAISKEPNYSLQAIKNGLSDLKNLKLIEIVDDIDNTPIYGAAKGAL